MKAPKGWLVVRGRDWKDAGPSMGPRILVRASAVRRALARVDGAKVAPVAPGGYRFGTRGRIGADWLTTDGKCPWVPVAPWRVGRTVSDDRRRGAWRYLCRPVARPVARPVGKRKGGAK